MQCPRTGFIGLSNRPLDAYGALSHPVYSVHQVNQKGTTKR